MKELDGRVAERLGKSAEYFSATRQGFANYTRAALDIVFNTNIPPRIPGNGKEVYFWLVNQKDGIIVIMYNGKLQTMFAATIKQFKAIK